MRQHLRFDQPGLQSRSPFGPLPVRVSFFPTTLKSLGVPGPPPKGCEPRMMSCRSRAMKHRVAAWESMLWEAVEAVAVPSVEKGRAT